MPRGFVVLTAIALQPVAAAVPMSVTDDYSMSNVRLARATPQFPGARLIRQEPTHGEVEMDTQPVSFEAVLRVSQLARPKTKSAVLAYYKRRLGSKWRTTGSACLTSGARVVVVARSGDRQLGLLMDSRGSRRCRPLAALLGDLLSVSG
jgi:hypothetical protein